MHFWGGLVCSQQPEGMLGALLGYKNMAEGIFGAVGGTHVRRGTFLGYSLGCKKLEGVVLGVGWGVAEAVWSTIIRRVSFWGQSGVQRDVGGGGAQDLSGLGGGGVKNLSYTAAA